jgi:hypothetical protein
MRTGLLVIEITHEPVRMFLSKALIWQIANERCQYKEIENE